MTQFIKPDNTQSRLIRLDAVTQFRVCSGLSAAATIEAKIDGAFEFIGELEKGSSFNLAAEITKRLVKVGE